MADISEIPCGGCNFVCPRTLSEYGGVACMKCDAAAIFRCSACRELFCGPCAYGAAPPGDALPAACSLMEASGHDWDAALAQVMSADYAPAPAQAHQLQQEDGNGAAIPPCPPAGPLFPPSSSHQLQHEDEDDDMNETNVGNLRHYHIDWSMRTEGWDGESGGHDFKRIDATGTLVFTAECYEEDTEVDTKVGTIRLTQYRMGYMADHCSPGLVHQIFDTTQEGLDAYEAVVRPLRDEFAESMQGDVQIVERVVVDRAHRGYGLALFMLEAADTVINGCMSAQILKPFPLQFERRGETYGFAPPPPPGTAEHAQAEKAALAKVTAHYEKLGFEEHDGSGFFLRWSGYRSPPLAQAMGTVPYY